MIRVLRAWSCLLGTIACLGGAGCQLRRPATMPVRMVEPQLLAPQPVESAKLVPMAPNAIPVRLLDSQSRGHIGRRLLHQQPNGELTEDPVWRWSSTPDRYLDTALRLEVASNPDIRVVDVGLAPVLAATLLVWDLEASGGHDWWGLWSFRSRGLTGWFIPGWREPVSPSQRSYRATWRPPQAGSCAAWRPTALRASQPDGETVDCLQRREIKSISLLRLLLFCVVVPGFGPRSAEFTAHRTATKLWPGLPKTFLRRCARPSIRQHLVPNLDLLQHSQLPR
jgi:hypothetical protein